jgi:hypothetical protein
VLLAVALALTWCAPTRAADAADSWTFSLTPYLWVPNIQGTLNFLAPPGVAGSPTVEIGADEYVKDLDMALMVSGEARKGAWAIFSDFIYLDFSGEKAAVRTVSGPGGMVQFPVNAGTQANLKGRVWELAASYAVSRSNTATVEVLGGFRYLGLKSTVNWQLAGSLGLFPQSGSFSQKEDLWDAIVGVRGRVASSSRTCASVA